MHGGLENLHHMTKGKTFELRVDMEDFEGNKVYSNYSSFRIGSESNGYVLEVSDFRDGGAGELQHTAVIHWGQSVTVPYSIHVCPDRKTLQNCRWTFAVSVGFGSSF